MMNLTGSLLECLESCLFFQGWDDHKLTLWKSAGSKHLSSIVLLDKNIQGMNIVTASVVCEIPFISQSFTEMKTSAC
jgi:hypothetical protein